MESGLNAAWLQQKVAIQNLSNLETPHYKSKSVVFEDVLNKNMRDYDKTPYQFRTSIQTNESTSRRPDENNVDADTESLSLYKAYVQYSYLTQKLNGSFANFRYVLNNAMK